MLYATVDPRMNTAASRGCGTCCCEPINMRPGEANLMTINYAPWSVPLMANGGPGLVGVPEVSIVKNSEACSSSVIDTFGPPDVPNLDLLTPLNTPVDVTFVPAPAGNTFVTEAMELFGPSHGQLSPQAPAVNGGFIYTPMTGYQGWDSFFVQTTDAQGRKVVSFVNIKVGAPTGFNDDPAFSGLRIQRSQAQMDANTQTVSFVMELSPDARECEFFTINIKQQARDCDRLFTHLTCIEVRVGKC